MKKNSLMVLFSFFISTSIFGQHLGDISFGSETTLEVITWNVEWFPKAGMPTVDSVSKIITALNADLIGLQEISDTVLCRQMVNNLPDYDLFMDDDWFGGLAYIYNTNTINVQSIYKIYDTPPYWTVFPRSPLVIEFEFENETFIVINNHFKCCGDGILEIGNLDDQEGRRYEASSLLKEYIDENFSTANVMVIGDLNDILEDDISDNVFQMFLDDPLNYMFADMGIAFGPVDNWSFPNWPSHLDHILISNELVPDLDNEGSAIETIKVDAFLPNGFQEFDQKISDHRPVGLKLQLLPTAQKELAKDQFDPALSPNPVFNSTQPIQIEFQEQHKLIDIAIFDLNGKIIHRAFYQQSKKIQFNLNLNPGVYFIRIGTGDQQVTKRLIKL